MYIIVLAVTAFIAIMYSSSTIPAMIVAFELALVPGCLFFLVWAICKTDAELKIEQNIAFSKDALSCFFSLNNRSFFPIPYIELAVDISNALENEKISRKIFIKVPAREQIKARITLQSQYCGVLHIAVPSFKIYDPIRLFHWKKRAGLEMEVLVLPKLEEMEVELTERCLCFETDGEEYDSHRKGDDPSEVLELRPYRPGDRLSQIHWKMSAKAGERMIKERSLPLGYPVGIFLDMRHDELSQADTLMRLFYSLSHSIIRAGCRHVIWHSDRDGGVCYKTIKTEDDILPVMEELLRIAIDGQELKKGIQGSEQSYGGFYQIYYLSAKIQPEELAEICSWERAEKRTLFAVEQSAELLSGVETVFSGTIETVQAEHITEQLSGRRLEI